MSWEIDFTREFSSAVNGSRDLVIAKYMERTGKSKQHLYRIAAAHGWDSGRKKRTDAGELKCALTIDQCEFISALLYETGRENKGPIMPVERAIQIAELNGIIRSGQVSPATMNRILRDRQLSKKHLNAETPYTEMRSLHPNHVHLVDVSVCIQYYLKSGKLAVMDERDFYDNKPHNFAKIKTRLLRYVLTDHFSGIFFFKYYDTTGETTDNLWDFLKDAWAHKKNEKFPFRGVPFQMLMDGGSGNQAKAISSLFEGLDINIPKGRPYNPRRQGSVESTHNIIEEWFESSLRIQPATSVEQMNAWAMDFMAWHQAVKKHTRHEMPRTTCWMLIKQEQLRELPSVEILQDLYANPKEKCTVYGDSTIRYRGERINVKHVAGIYRGAKVMAHYKPLKWPVVDVIYNEQRYECGVIERLPMTAGGFSAHAAIIGQEYKAQPETMTQQAMKRMDNMAYGEIEAGKELQTKKSNSPFAGLEVFGNLSDGLDNIAFMPKRGTAIEVDRGIVDANISIMELFGMIRQNGLDMTPTLNQQLRTEFGASITKSKAEEVIAEIKAGTWIRGQSNDSSDDNTEDQIAIAL